MQVRVNSHTVGNQRLVCGLTDCLIFLGRSMIDQTLYLINESVTYATKFS